MIRTTRSFPSLRALLVAALAGVAAGCAPRSPTTPGPGTIEPPLKHAPAPTTAAITAEDLRTYVYAFADDSMMGRQAGTEGNVRGTEYLAREAARIGLVPAGENGTYFQTLPLRRRTAGGGTEPLPFPARNVVAVLPGSDPALRGEYVALGAHNDHVGVAEEAVSHDSLRIFNEIVRPGGAEDRGRSATPAQQAEVNRRLAEWRAAHPASARPDSIFNGADDDASGSASLLEVAAKLASLDPRPRRSVLFVWHNAEELGLLGSEYFTDHPTVPRDSIVAQLNIDMVGRGAADDETGRSREGTTLHGGPDYLQLVGSRRLSTELGELIEAVNREAGHRLRLDYAMDANGHPMNIYCRSDHYSYARYGIPVTFFTTGGHRDYHQVTDEPQYIDYDHMARVVSLIADVAARLANQDHRPVVDQPVPPLGSPCRQ